MFMNMDDGLIKGGKGRATSATISGNNIRENTIGDRLSGAISTSRFREVSPRVVEQTDVDRTTQQRGSGIN